MESLPKTGSRLQPNTTMATARALIQKANQSNEPISLAKNALLRGLVTDLRPGVVTIKLANKQTIVAKLEGSNEVSIGDVAPFRIIENDGGTLTLRKLNTNISAEEATIQKALEEADLPTTDVNHSIVKELLYHKLPINKETINMILNKADQFPNASVETIVHLTKLGMELDEPYLSHFESYKQFDHRLMQHIDQIGEQLALLLNTASIREPLTTFLPLATSILNFLEIENGQMEDFIEVVEDDDAELPSESEDQIAEDIDTEDTQEVDALSAEETTTHQHSPDQTLTLSGREQKQLLKLFSSYDKLPEEYTASIHENTLSLRETVQHLTEAISYYSEHAPQEIAAFKTPLVLDLFEQFSDMQKANGELSSLLSTGERNELLSALKDLPLSQETVTMIANGEMTIDTFLGLIGAFSTEEYEASLRSLFSKHAFNKLLTSELTSMFSLTPDELLDAPNSVTAFYNSLLDKMEELKSIASLASSDASTASLAGKMDGLKENLDFMQDFNKLFTYIQLPVKLKEQVTHGDLYVYTNKKKLQSGTKNISVLLHLDMDHLGPLDIYLALTSNTVHSKFYVSDKETAKLMQRESRDLVKSLEEKGFTLTSEFLEQPKQANILKDLVEREESTTPIRRYSFDMRT